MSPDTPSVRVQLILDAAKAFNRVLDEQAELTPPIKVTIGTAQGRLAVEEIVTNPTPERLWPAEAEEASDD